MDINKILVFHKVSLGKNGVKYFIGYKDGKNIRPLCIMLPKKSAYRRDFYWNRIYVFVYKRW